MLFSFGSLYLFDPSYYSVIQGCPLILFEAFCKNIKDLVIFQSFLGLGLRALISFYTLFCNFCKLRYNLRFIDAALLRISGNRLLEKPDFSLNLY